MRASYSKLARALSDRFSATITAQDIRSWASGKPTTMVMSNQVTRFLGKRLIKAAFERNLPVQVLVVALGADEGEKSGFAFLTDLEALDHLEARGLIIEYRPKLLAPKAAKIRVPARPKSVLNAAQRRALAVIQGRAKTKAPKVAPVEAALPKTPKAIAKAIVAKLASDKKFSRRVARSPEPFRAMIYESGLVPNAAAIDGSARYHSIVDALEAM